MPTAPRWTLAIASLSLLALSAPGVSAKTELRSEEFVQIGAMHGGGGFDVGPFAMRDAPLGGSQAPASAAMPASLSGSRIAAIRGGVLAIDEDSGMLVRTDGSGNKLAELRIGSGAGQLVVDTKANRAYVADRSHDRIAVVEIGETLKLVDAFGTKAEPYGLALDPDRRTLFVTTVADRNLTAIDIATGNDRWSTELGPEPRGVAVSPSGDEALVTFLTTGTVARVRFGEDADARPKISFVTLDPSRAPTFANSGVAPIDPALSDEGKSFARNAFAAMYVGHDVAVVPHQLSSPHLASDDFQPEASGYGGGNGFTAPVSHRLAFLGMPDRGEKGGVRTAMADTNLHQPRALAYDGKSDTLYVAGFGSDDVLAIAKVSQASIHSTWQMRVADGETGCGPDGLAVDPDDGQVLVWCSLTRQVVRLAGDPESTTAPTVIDRSEALAKSNLSASAQRGRDLFRKRTPQVSQFGAMACSSCHAEQRADGLSWRLQGKNLQTPLLAGRIHEDAAPFKWDGKDANITASLTNTVTRLGGTGISKNEADDLAAFLDSVKAPRTPSVDDTKAVARGKALFEGTITGCATCHSGAALTDQNQYPLAKDLDEVDTPSLVGLATSAPYYHDGSAATLDALLKEKASIHGMGDVSKLTEAQISDLVQYLKTL